MADAQAVFHRPDGVVAVEDDALEDDVIVDAEDFDDAGVEVAMAEDRFFSEAGFGHDHQRALDLQVHGVGGGVDAAAGHQDDSVDPGGEDIVECQLEIVLGIDLDLARPGAA